MDMSIPSIQDLKKYSINVTDNTEVIRQGLYDFQLYPTAGAAQFTFFTSQQGQGKTSANGAVVASPKTKFDTNMQLSGQLPIGQAFLAESIEVFFLPGTVSTADTWTPYVGNIFNATPAAALLQAAINDNFTIRQSGGLRFFIGSKEYLFEQPLQLFPQKTYTGVEGAIAASTGGEVASLASVTKGRPYFLDVPIPLIATQNFNVTIEFPTAVATPSGFNGRIGVRLDGYLFRNVQ